MADAIRIEVRGIEAVRRKFDLLAKNAPDMAARIINYTGRDVRKAIQASISSTFNEPTPFTLKSVYSSSAYPNKLYTEVGLKEYRTKTGGVRPHYMRVHEAGGARPMKISEERLGGYYVPGAAAKLNRYGNITEIQKILSALGIRLDAAQRTDLVRSANTRRGSRPGQRNRRLYWIGRVGKKQTLGVWAVGETYNGRRERIRPVLIFPDQGRKAPVYNKRWPFFTIGRDEYRRSLPRNANFFFNAWVKGLK